MLYILEEETTLKYYNSFLTQYKGIEGINNITVKSNTKQFILININNAPYTLYKGYMTELGEINGI